MQPFSILLAVGAGLGLFWAAWQVPEKQAVSTADTGLWALFGALLGGRAGHVIAEWSYFRSAPFEMIQVWLGGLSGVGALAGAGMAVLLTAFFTRRHAGKLADALLPLLATVGAAAWLGCWLDGCLYGAASNDWWALPARDEAGAVAARVPVQLLGALLLVGWLTLLDQRLGGQARPGLAAGLGMFGVSIELFGLSFLRADPGIFWNGLRLEAWGALALAAISAAALVPAFLQHKGAASVPPTTNHSTT